MHFYKKLLIVFFLSVEYAQANDNNGLGPGFIDAAIIICSDGDSKKATAVETQILSNLCGSDSLSERREMLRHHRNSKDPLVRAAYDKEFNEIMDNVKSLSKEQKAEMCKVLMAKPTSC